MRIQREIHQFLFLIIFVCTCILGCGGKGSTLLIGNIMGPDSVNEYAVIEFSIAVEGATAITYQWSCNPSHAGEFDNPTSAVTKFTTADVLCDKPVEITVVIYTNGLDPVMKTKRITILAAYGLQVGEIDGPESLDEESCITYSVTATGGTGILYQWSCVPEDAGYFDTPTFQTTTFTAGKVPVDWPVEIKVEVSSDNNGPILKTKCITIVDRELSGWVHMLGGIWSDAGYGVALDSYNNVYIAGVFMDTVDFDPIQETAKLQSNGTSDAFLCKYDYAGRIKWARHWGGAAEETVNGMAVDDEGNAYIIGEFRYTVDFDPGQGIDERTSSDGWDIYITKFNSDGCFQWVQTWGGEYYDVVKGVAVGNPGDVYVTGNFSSKMDFCPGPGVDTHTSSGSDDAYLSKFNQDGDFEWAQTWGGSDYDIGLCVTADDSDNVFVTGRFYYAADFDPGPGETICKSRGRSDVFLSKFNPNGDFLWVRTWGGHDYDTGRGVAVDENDNVYVTGYFEASPDFDPGPGDATFKSKGWSDVFLSKFNPNGDFQWARTWGGTRWDCGYSVAVGDNGSAYVTGYFQEIVNFNPGPQDDVHMSYGDDDVFLSCFDPDGNYQWCNTWGGADEDFGSGVATDDSSSAYVTGYFQDDFDLDPRLGIGEYASNGEMDIFLIKFPPTGIL